MEEVAPPDFNLDARVEEWRRWQERTSSLSPRELDELEDHLRAAVDLEMELNAGVGPAGAFRIASREIGPGAVLSKEFAKVGKSGWRRMFLQGWALYAASFLSPAGGWEFDYGYQVFQLPLSALIHPQILAFIVLPNLAMLMTIPVLLGGKPPCGRFVKWLLGVAGTGAMGTVVVVSAIPMIHPWSAGFLHTLAGYGAGFWAWAASLTFVAAALRRHALEWGPAKPGKPDTPPRILGQGAYQ